MKNPLNMGITKLLTTYIIFYIKYKLYVFMTESTDTSVNAIPEKLNKFIYYFLIFNLKL